MTNQTAAYAIFATADPGDQTDSLQYVTEASDATAAYEDFADDVFSGDRSVEAGWTWHVFEIPTEIADDRDAIYAHIDDRSPTAITTERV